MDEVDLRERLAIAEAMARAYKADRVGVAELCDYKLDRSGALLGWLRNVAGRDS